MDEAHSRPWRIDVARQKIEALKGLDGALLPILHALQAEFGYIDPAAEPMIADALNLTRAEVHGVVTFYHDFRRLPAGTHVLKLCRAEACQAAGGEALAARAEAALGVATGATTADGAATLEAVYCLGLCALAPSAMLDGRVVGRLDEARLDQLIAEARSMTRARLPPRRCRRGRGRRRRRRADAAHERGQTAASPLEIVRTGSRGLYWLEPMVEVETPEGRIAYGPITRADVDALLDAGLLDGRAERLRLGPTDAHPLAEAPDAPHLRPLRHHRPAVARRLSCRTAATAGLERAIALGAAATVEEIEKSGLRGRGGAGFPTGIKWRTVAEAKSAG